MRTMARSTWQTYALVLTMAVRDRGPTQRKAEPAARAAKPPKPQNDLAESAALERLDAKAVPIQGAEVRLAARMSERLAVPTATSFSEIDVTTLEAERAGARTSPKS